MRNTLGINLKGNGEQECFLLIWAPDPEVINGRVRAYLNQTEKGVSTLDEVRQRLGYQTFVPFEKCTAGHLQRLEIYGQTNRYFRLDGDVVRLPE